MGFIHIQVYMVTNLLMLTGTKRHFRRSGAILTDKTTIYQQAVKLHEGLNQPAIRRFLYSHKVVSRHHGALRTTLFLYAVNSGNIVLAEISESREKLEGVVATALQSLD